MGMSIFVEVNQVGPSTSESIIRSHKVLIDRPEAKGGADQGPMGGEYLLTAFGGCFMSNLLAAAMAREAELSDVKIMVTGELDGNPARFVSIHLDIYANYADRALMEKLVLISERSCICANTLKDSVKLSFVIK